MKIVSTSYLRGSNKPIAITSSLQSRDEVIVTHALSIEEAEDYALELIQKLAMDDSKNWKGLAIDFQRNYEFVRAARKEARRT